MQSSSKFLKDSKQSKYIKIQGKVLPSSFVVTITGADIFPSPGWVKHNTVIWYSVCFKRSVKLAFSVASGYGLGGIVIVFVGSFTLAGSPIRRNNYVLKVQM